MKKSHTLTKADIVNKIAEGLEIRHKDAVRFYEALFREIEEALIEEGHVKLTSFASFTVRQKKERMGRSPKTKIPAVIPPRKVVLFHPSQYLKEFVRERTKR